MAGLWAWTLGTWALGRGQGWEYRRGEPELRPDVGRA